jgi:large subunit ribosomal protein L28
MGNGKLNAKLLPIIMLCVRIRMFTRGGVLMATVCYVCNKERQTGSKVSHSNRHSNRRWNPNIKRVKAVVDGSPKRIYVCTRCLRSGKVARSV